MRQQIGDNLETLSFISRCLLVAAHGRLSGNAEATAKAYREIVASLDGTAPDDDFDFAEILRDCGTHLPYAEKSINRTSRCERVLVARRRQESPVARLASELLSTAREL